MVLPIEVSSDDVDRYSAYYTSFFETSYDVSSREVTFNMVSNDAKSRRVILRFLGANKIQTVKVGDKSFLRRFLRQVSEVIKENSKTYLVLPNDGA